MGDTRCVKVRLNALFERKDQRVIEAAVRDVHCITSRALLLVKAFYLHWHATAPEPEAQALDEDFLCKAFSLVQGKGFRFRKQRNEAEQQDARAQEKQLTEQLEEFYNRNIKPFVQSTPGDSLSLSHVLAYSATALETAYRNNISGHFTSYVYKLGHHQMRQLVLSHHFPDVMQFGDLPRAERSRWVRRINAAVEDILHHRSGAAMRCSEDFLCDWVEAHRGECVPGVPDLDADLYLRPWLYLRYMVRMMQLLETASQGKVRLMSPLVLRRSFIPSHIRIDISALLHLFMDVDRISTFRDWYRVEYGVDLAVSNKADICSSLKKLAGLANTSPAQEEEHQQRVWLFLTKLGQYGDKAPWAGTRRSGPDGAQERWRFDYAISTDGYSMSVQTTRRPPGLKKRQCRRGRTGARRAAELPSLGGDVQQWQHLAHQEGVVLVGVDPGKNNLVTMVDGKRNVLTVTAKQKKRYEGSSSHSRWLDEFKARTRAWDVQLVTRPGVVQEPVTVSQAEKQCMGKTNSKSCHLGTLQYVATRLRLEQQLLQCYTAKRHRRHHFASHCRERSFEDKLCNAIETTFKTDPSDQVVAFWGNWGRQPNGLRHQPPTPGIGLRRKVHKRVLTLTTNEGYTSQRCACCHHQVTEVHHSLLRCDNGTCSQWWARDVMAALNIRSKGIHLLVHGEAHPAFVAAHD